MVDKIVECQFTENELIVPASYSDEDRKYFYRFFLQAIYDAHLPVTKAIGFALNTPKQLMKQSAVNRCSQCLENMIEIASNLDDKVFFNVSNNIVSSGYMEGKISTEDVIFTSNAKQVEILCVKPYIMTSIQVLNLEIFVESGVGFRSMEENSREINKSKYFPLNSYHSLLGYVRVLPYNGHIRYKLYRGMTPDKLRDVFYDLYYRKLAGKLEGSEQQWESSFPL